MSRWIVDTNVAIVANGRLPPNEPRPPTVECRLTAVEFLVELMDRHVVLLDLDGRVQDEYRRHLRPSGQPGVGDRFYQAVLMSAPERIERVHLPVGVDGVYADLPEELLSDGFDPADYKFAAMAIRHKAPVANAVDSDWVQHGDALNAAGVTVQNLCGCEPAAWFAP